MGIDKIEFKGKVTDGVLHIVHRQKMSAEIKAYFDGKEVEIIIRRKKRIRSNAMNRYYWGVIVKSIQDGLKDVGTKLNLEEADLFVKDLFKFLNPKLVHDFLKDMFIEKIDVDPDTGEIIENEITTRKMSNAQFIEYITPIYQWAAEFLNIQIPLPNEEYEIPEQYKNETPDELQ